MQRFRWAAAVGLIAAAIVMTSVIAASGDHSRAPARTMHMPSTATRARVALTARTMGTGQAVIRGAEFNTSSRRSTTRWRTRIALINCAKHGQLKPKRLSLSCAWGGHPRGNYVNGLRWRRWSRRQGSARAVGEEHPATCGGTTSVAVILWRPRPWHGHAGKFHFTRMTVINKWTPTAWSPKTQTIHLWS
jgi:hypothetical protein